MRPLQDFARTVMEARKAFDADRSMTAWLVFYEAKQAAYAKLATAVPQVTDIEDFWRYAQNTAPALWVPIIEGEIARVTKSRCLCARCQKVKVSWPERLCDGCRKVRRSEAVTKARLTRKLKEQMRKCPICKTTPLQARQRKCDACKQSVRRERNKRYQKSLEEAELRRLQSTFTKEAMLTVGETDQLRDPTQMLTAEASLAGPLT